MEWLYYLLEANLYLLLFYGFYKLFLSKTTFYSSNRYYLLISSIAAFILPITQLGFLNPTPIVDNEMFPQPILYTAEQLANITVTNTAATIDYTSYFYPIYLFIAFCFTIKLVFSLLKIIRLWLKAKKQSNGNVTLVELNEEKSAFSFFNLLFIHPHLAGTKVVLRHEMVHIKQKHSVDILFFEIIQIICWFNPIIYILKKDIKLVHEYIADELSTNAEMQKHEYAMFLIENSFGIMPKPLTNQIFNQSILKRRINMLNKKRTAGWARLRLLLALPLAGAMLCTSTMAFTKDYGYLDLLPEKSNEIAPIQEKPKVENIKKQQPPKVQEIKNPKTDQVKFPPPIVDKFFPMRNVDENGEINFIDQRYIIINGKKIKDINTFFGITNITKIVSLNQKNAKKKYGAIAKYGAIEITGNNLMYVKSLADGPPPPTMTQVKFSPPIVKPNGKDLKNPPPVEPPPPGYKTKREQVKFPPPIVKVNQKGFSPRSQLKHDGKEYLIIKPDNRYIVINGNPVSDMYQFYGVMNTESVTILTPNQATKIYGNEKGKYGAVEIKGVGIKYVPGFVGPPLPSVNLELDRSKGDLLKIPNTTDEIKTLTVYNDKGKVIYNSTDYNDNWDGKMGNYSEFSNQKITPKSYSFLVKIIGKQFSNVRGRLIIK